ncbi:MAG: alpha/beta fold hydrolase [Deltaproteobacteria bacterium]
MPVRIFIHGLESSNKGTKSVFFKEKFPDMIIPHFTGGLEERMEKLREILLGKSGLNLVGSSFGGLMATLFSVEQPERVKSMVLLAPAINLVKFAPQKTRKISLPVRLYHGKNDRVVPFSEVEPVAKALFADLTVNVVDDDHFLHRTFKSIDWDVLLA